MLVSDFSLRYEWDEIGRVGRPSPDGTGSALLYGATSHSPTVSAGLPGVVPQIRRRTPLIMIACALIRPLVFGEIKYRKIISLISPSELAVRFALELRVHAGEESPHLADSHYRHQLDAVARRARPQAHICFVAVS